MCSGKPDPYNELRYFDNSGCEQTVRGWMKVPTAPYQFVVNADSTLAKQAEGTLLTDVRCYFNHYIDNLRGGYQRQVGDIKRLGHCAIDTKVFTAGETVILTLVHTHPVVVLQWGDVSVDGDDYQEIVENLSVHVYPDDAKKMEEECPTIYHQIIESDNPADFLSAIITALRRNPDVQFFYIAAHGDGEHLLYSIDGQSKISLAEIGELFNNPLLSGSVHVVFGACHSMTRMHRIEQHIGTAVHCLIGFTFEPTNLDTAALMAGVLADAIGLFSKLSRVNRIALGQISEEEKNRFKGVASAVAKALKDVVDNHTPEEIKYINDNGGLAVIVAERDVDSGGWNRRIMPLM